MNSLQKSVLPILILCLTNFPSISTEIVSIPGCPDLTTLPGDINELSKDQLTKLKCFCNGITNDLNDPDGIVDSENTSTPGIGIAVSCIFGSHLEDLAEVLTAIDDANRTVTRITLDHVEISEDEAAPTLEEILSSDLRDLRELEIKDCRGGALTERRDNPIVEFSELPSLEAVIIENCELTTVPSGLLSKTTKLNSLSLPGNKIIDIKAGDFDGVTETLEYLDLSSNLLSAVEPNSISQLNALKTLIIGEHNYANETLLQQIGSLQNLEKLDMTRMDGVDDLDKLGFERNGGGKNLKEWTLTGCSLKAINDTPFEGLGNLEELDIRVNLIENIEPGTFEPLRNLRKLSLAGNFLRESMFDSNVFEGLESLEFLDLGWNEIKVLHAGVFDSLGKTLNSLSLRHNEKLVQIEPSTFSGLNHLKFLNLSGTALEKVEKSTFKPLAELEELHLSHTHISEIESGAFNAQNETLRVLSLNGNQLTQFDFNATLKPLHSLEQIDLSKNPWLCDAAIWQAVTWVQKTYRNAAETSREFFLLNSADTQCARPYNLAGRGLLDLVQDDLPVEYDAGTDTTTPAATTEASTDDGEGETSTLINFGELLHVVGTSGNDTLDAIEDEGKPKYDINTVRFGQKTTSKNPTNSMFATITVTLLVIVTVIGILFVVRRNKTNACGGNPPPEKAQSGVTTTV
uniref:Leucine-rich repeat domain-containing protein n=1 Tax=Panagrellus redivivus TaxID=6233 RepID=A0A7E4UNE6_PANRE